jgi:hypothetical protein
VFVAVSVYVVVAVGVTVTGDTAAALVPLKVTVVDPYTDHVSTTGCPGRMSGALAANAVISGVNCSPPTPLLLLLALQPPSIVSSITTTNAAPLRKYCKPGVLFLHCIVPPYPIRTSRCLQ